MIISIQKILITNVTLKAFSCILGYVTWYIIACNCMHTIQATIPLTFYHIPPHWSLHAPENITVTLSGTRNTIHSIDTTILAAHISGSSLQEGSQLVTLTAQQLFLPSSVKLVHYNPAPLLIKITQKT